jgi:hypothetical protein
VVQLVHESIASSDLTPEIAAGDILMITHLDNQRIVFVEGSEP